MLTIPTTAKQPITLTAEPGENVLSIAYPADPYRSFNGNLSFAFRVFNDTGFQLTDPTCRLNIADDNLDAVFTGIVTPNADGAYKVIVEDGMLEYGSYTYIIRCNRTGQAGWVNSEIFLTSDGNEPPDDLTPAGLSVLIPLVFAVLCLFVISVLGEGHAALKIFLTLLSFLSISVSYNYIILVTSLFYSPVISETIASDLVWFGWVIYIIIVYFVIHWLIQITTNLNDRKIRKLKFNDEGEEKRKW